MRGIEDASIMLLGDVEIADVGIGKAEAGGSVGGQEGKFRVHDRGAYSLQRGWQNRAHPSQSKACRLIGCRHSLHSIAT